MLYASADLGGTNIAVMLAEADGVARAAGAWATESHRGPVGVLERIATLIESLAEQAGERPVALGLGIPGLVEIATGTTRFLPNLPTNWRGVPAGDWLAERLRMPVYLLNDARMAALGELAYGHGRIAKSFAFFTLGTGVGGGVVLDGRLRLGPLGAAGELGHQTVVPDGPRCGCGNRGCVEAVASASALIGEGVRLLRSGQAPALHELTGGDLNQVTPITMAAAADCDEAVAFAIDRLARLLGLGVANVVTILHPELIVLGGGMAALGERLFTPVREAIATRVCMFPTAEVRVEPALTGDRAGALGGITLARQRYSQSL
jgi:glucokinase